METLLTVEELQALGRALATPVLATEESRTIVEARRLLKMRDRNGVERPLEANRAQRSFEEARKAGNIVLKARQMGMTTWVSARFFLKTITTPGALTVQVAQTREAAESTFRIVQRFWQGLPEALRTGALKRSRANVRQMVFPQLDSEFRVLSAADGNAGRGLSIQNLHCSEVSRWQGDARETLAGLRAALSPTGELVLESTPNGAAGCFYDQWMEAAESGLARHFFPWWLEEAYVGRAATRFTDEELELMQRHQLTPEQIGFRRDLEASYRGLRSQEFAEDAQRCFRASGNCCFEIEAIEDRLLALGEPIREEDRGTLLTWFAPVDGKDYIVAVDPSGGGSDGDFCGIEVIDMALGLQCAELRQQLRPVEVARASRMLAERYNKALLVVEANNHGSAVHAFLDTTEHYENIYGADGVAGFLTTASSKPRIIGNLGALLFEHADHFYSKRLLGECRTFVTQPNGGTGAATGAHDDLVMAMAIAQEVRARRLERPNRRLRAVS